MISVWLETPAPHLAVVHHHDTAAAQHGVEAVGDDELGAAVEGAANRLLDQPVHLPVNGRRRLVQQQDLCGNSTGS